MFVSLKMHIIWFFFFFLIFIPIIQKNRQQSGQYNTNTI